MMDRALVAQDPYHNQSHENEYFKPGGPFCYQSLTLIPACNYISCELWDEITYLFPKFTYVSQIQI